MVATKKSTKVSKKRAGAKKGAAASHRTSSSKSRPDRLRIRAYQVGFGDCFLLTFYYPKAKREVDQKRHVLIDFGSTGLPEGTTPDQMLKVARDIEKECRQGKLCIVVATHRHKDHVSGFATDGAGTGNIIKNLKPEIVIQPWTEEPDAQDPKLEGDDKSLRQMPVADQLSADQRRVAFVSSLQNMNSFSGTLLSEVEHMKGRPKLRQALDSDVTEQVEFLTNDNKLPNRSAVLNLATMAKNHYVSHGYHLDLSKLLPGVKAHVLGPPTLEQHAKIRTQKSRDKSEFWMLQAAANNFWGMQATSGELLINSMKEGGRLFTEFEPFREIVPPYMRWFVRQMCAARANQMLGLVRVLDKAMNNTSVILLFEVGGKKLLFPGDAQIENWEYALHKDEDMRLLQDVDVYKVGHHGSRNATPKTLWESFEHKTDAVGAPGRLKTVISTMKGKHGRDSSHTEVPRKTLVKALDTYSDYHTTQTAAETNELYVDLPVDL